MEGRMTLEQNRMREMTSWALCFCAVVSTVILVRREFSASAEVEKLDPIYIEDWRGALPSGLRVGAPDAPVQLLEFADFQCPACARFESSVTLIRSKFPNSIAITLAHFPLEHHSLAVDAARAAECAEKQGRFNEIRTVLFEGQKNFGSIPWVEFARLAGVPDSIQFDECVHDTHAIERVQEGRRLGERFGVNATPTIIVNGWKLPQPPTVDQLEAIVDNILAGRSPFSGVEFVAPNRRS
jgi:predicted DsbA family dithiol-disulfide isomerase